MKKFSLTILTAVAVLVGSNAQALPINAAGAGGYVEMNNATLTNDARLQNDRNMQLCQGVLCNVSNDGTINVAGGYVEMNNATVTNKLDSSNTRNSQVCQGVICNNTKR